jgi:hypothetical protein
MLLPRGYSLHIMRKDRDWFDEMTCHMGLCNEAWRLMKAEDYPSMTAVDTPIA